jgi:hypothetical protein
MDQVGLLQYEKKDLFAFSENISSPSHSLLSPPPICTSFHR